MSEGRSYVFYRRTGDNEKSDGCLPREKQLFPPQAALGSAAPCRGAFQTAVSQKPPLQGEVDAPLGADGGVHCRFAVEVSCKAGQGLALCFVRDDARIVPENHAPPQGSAAGENAHPTLRPGADGGIQPAAPTRPNGRSMKSSAPTQGAALHDRHPPAMPAGPDPAARLPYIVGRAFTPAGKVCGVVRLSSKKILEKTGAGCKIPAGPFVV